MKSKKNIEPNVSNREMPLAERMRPKRLEDFVGQEEIIGQGKLLRQLIDNDQLSSIILWGPPGVGKTTLAHIIAEQTAAHFSELSAVMSGKDALRDIVAEAESRLQNSERTVLFIDEIHRWNKAQQDALLPYVERGTVILVGATTENPSFEIIGALLSRSRVFVLKYLTAENIKQLIGRALDDKIVGLGNNNITIADDTLALLAELAGGDARAALNALELAVKAKIRTLPLLKKEGQGEVSGAPTGETPPNLPFKRGGNILISNEDIKEALNRSTLVFDKKGEEFYNIISALHKSMRGSDANAALYWLARMLEGGVDPLYVARRVLRFASEDIGMANSEALIQANAAYEACHKIGMPECTVHLAQAVVYCAKATKSNLLYRAYNAAAKDAHETSHIGVPLHLRNATTQLMKDLDYGKNYLYNPSFEEPVAQDYLPPELKGKNYLAK
jgi:putative ATPase